MSPFIQIAASGDGLYALDKEGGVWMYHPAETRAGKPTRYAFWGQLTEHRSEPNWKAERQSRSGATNA